MASQLVLLSTTPPAVAIKCKKEAAAVSVAEKGEVKRSCLIGRLNIPEVIW